MAPRAWIVLGICSLFTAGCSDELAPGQAVDARRAEIASMFEDAARDGFSGAALVTVDNERVFAKGYGDANREAGTPNTTETAFDVGSLMKNLTAAAIFRLDQDARLSLADTLGELYPDAPEDKSGITVLQIVQHVAGFDEYHDTEGDFEAMTREEARARIFAQELLFEPGSDEAYSNSGYTLLADIVETASGGPFTDYVREKIFAPAGMEHSGFYADDVWETTDTAVGYGASTFGANDPATWPYTWALVGNGGLVSTVEDLDRWLVGLEGGAVLSAEAFESMRSEYLARGAAVVGGETVYAGAGAGDFGLGGVEVSAPGRGLRILIASNAYDDFDAETLAATLISKLLAE
jgi:CubicO group peptidase (beta-lactamase class C family)